MARLFTIEEANKALTFVGPVVEDLMRLWDDMVDEDKQYQTLARLEQVAAELRLVGCDLRDIQSGTVDFPSLYKGDLVQLSWKVGEKQINFWHKDEADFRERKEINDEFLLFNSASVDPVSSPH